MFCFFAVGNSTVYFLYIEQRSLIFTKESPNNMAHVDRSKEFQSVAFNNFFVR